MFLTVFVSNCQSQSRNVFTHTHMMMTETLHSCGGCQGRDRFRILDSRQVNTGDEHTCVRFQGQQAVSRHRKLHKAAFYFLHISLVKYSLMNSSHTGTLVILPLRFSYANAMLSLTSCLSG